MKLSYPTRFDRRRVEAVLADHVGRGPRAEHQHRRPFRPDEESGQTPTRSQAHRYFRHARRSQIFRILLSSKPHFCHFSIPFSHFPIPFCHFPISFIRFPVLFSNSVIFLFYSFHFQSCSVLIMSSCFRNFRPPSSLFPGGHSQSKFFTRANQKRIISTPLSSPSCKST